LDKLRNRVDELVSALADTSVYREYTQAKSTITNDELEKINSYKGLKIKLINTYSSEDDRRARELYRKLMLNSKTRNYMLCEKRFLNLVTGIYDEIGSGLEADIKFDM